MSERRSYPIFITINDKVIHKVVIDPHYEVKHKESITDETIIALTQMLDGKFFTPEAEKDGFLYFKTK